MGELTNIVQGGAKLWVDGVSVGFTLEPVTQTIDREYTDIIVEQIKGVIGLNLNMEKCTIKTVLAEDTLANLKMQWDQGGSSLLGGTFLNIGTEEGATYHTLTIIAPIPSKTGKLYRNYHIFKAVSYATGEQVFARAELTKVPVTFVCCKDVLNGNLYGYVHDSNVEGA